MTFITSQKTENRVGACRRAKKLTGPPQVVNKLQRRTLIYHDPGPWASAEWLFLGIREQTSGHHSYQSG